MKKRLGSGEEAPARRRRAVSLKGRPEPKGMHHKDKREKSFGGGKTKKEGRAMAPSRSLARSHQRALSLSRAALSVSVHTSAAHAAAGRRPRGANRARRPPSLAGGLKNTKQQSRRGGSVAKTRKCWDAVYLRGLVAAGAALRGACPGGGLRPGKAAAPSGGKGSAAKQKRVWERIERCSGGGGGEREPPAHAAALKALGGEGERTERR